MSQVVYLYGFLPPGSPAPGPELTGLEERPVEVLELEGFAAAVGRLPASSYGEEALEERVGDLRWMAHRGFLHERVVTWFVDREGILPARFLTLHSTEEALRQEARARGDRIRALLSRFKGRREWNVKLTLDETRLLDAMGNESPEVRSLDREIEAASPGRRYLLERRREELARDQVDRVAARLTSGVLEELGRHAEAVERLPLAQSEGSERVVAHAALLVRRTDEGGLQETADAGAATLSRRGLALELTGPWAPYRFVREPQAREPERAAG